MSYGRLIAAGVVGNILEWYDFSIYGYFAVTIGRHFFPAQTLTTSMIEAFGAFGAGFLTRPLGALLFGWIGDHHGRERALTLSIFAMALPTFLTGLLPDYAAIGLLAPITLVSMERPAPIRRYRRLRCELEKGSAELQTKGAGRWRIISDSWGLMSTPRRSQWRWRKGAAR
jgi:MFS family permease